MQFWLKPFWLKLSDILAQGGVASACPLVCGVFSLLHPRQSPMGRRGWKSFDAPTGWVQVIRGPRVGQQQQIAQQNQKPVQVRTPQNQVKTSGIRPFVDPSVKLAAAKERAVKLETALAAMEGMEGPEVESVRAAHMRAQEAVQGVPLDIQIKECESFLARATSHLEEMDTNRAVICQNIEMSKKRLEELEAQSVSPPVQEDGAEVQHLRGLVSQLQAQIETLRQNSVGTTNQKGQFSRGNVGEKILILSATRRWRSGWPGATQISKLQWCRDRSPRWPESHS